VSAAGGWDAIWRSTEDISPREEEKGKRVQEAPVMMVDLQQRDLRDLV